MLQDVTALIWEPECEQEMSFGGESQRTKLKKDYVRDLYQKLTEKYGVSEAFRFDYFELRDGEVYYKGKSMPLTNRVGKQRLAGVITEILGKGGLRNLGFDIPKSKLTAWQAVMLNKSQEELPFESDVDKADDIELQEIMENASKSTEDLISHLNDQQSQTDDLFKHPIRKLLGLDKQLRSIRGLLKVEVAKKVQLEESIKKEHQKLKEFQEYPGVYDDAMREDITKQIDALNDELKVRQES